ncbi:MAG TPA: hypothetical protein PLB55_18360 [Prosthecobacter sp.]|nr:hypothetical protein [Prosthecobacter sp.]
MQTKFSATNQAVLEDFLNLGLPCDSNAVSELWSRHYWSLEGARGVFAVTNQQLEKKVPGNQNFGRSGFLRCWLSNTRLLLIQNANQPREFRYSSPIFCDTNFVSFCEAFDAERSLGDHKEGFEEAIRFLIPISSAASAFPYLIENAENPNKDRVRATLRSFAAFKLTSLESFNSTNKFSHQSESYSSDQIADGCLTAMEDESFKVIHQRMKQHFLMARIVLLKCALIVFKRQALTLEKRFFALLEFLHEEIGRLPQFESLAAYRFFDMDVGTSFFQRIQRNSRSLDRTLTAMSWDLAHWRSALDMLLMGSNRKEEPAFPLPHFLSFDQPFVELIDGMLLDGIVYKTNPVQYMQIPNGSLIQAVSELYSDACNKFYQTESCENRAVRACVGNQFTDQLVSLESALALELVSEQSRNT